jgi:peptide chain release factor 3
MGYDFQGIYNLWEQNINLFSGVKKYWRNDCFSDVQNPELEKIIGQNQLIDLREELELIDIPKIWSSRLFRRKTTTCFFGSALNILERIIDCFVQIAPSPRPKDSETRLVDPKEEKCLICF